MAKRTINTQTGLREQALSYLNRFGTTVAGMRRHLRGKVRDAVQAGEVEPGEGFGWVEPVLERLVRAGLLDDARYAASRARVLHGRGKGKRVIQQDLRRRGVSDEDGQAALEALAETHGDPELKAACNLARRRRLGPWYRGEDRAERRQKHLATLARSGFSFDTARQVIDADDIDTLLDD